MPRTLADGWTVEITHPSTGRVIRPTILDEPTYLPSLKSKPEIRLPVDNETSWLSDGFDDGPEMSVWRDGELLPIETLVDVEETQTHSMLIGEGGGALSDRVTIEFDEKSRDEAAEDIINTTGYTAEIDKESFPTIENRRLLTLEEETDWRDAVQDEPGDGDWWDISDSIQTLQTSWMATSPDDLDTGSGMLIDDDAPQYTDDAEGASAYLLGPGRGSDINDLFGTLSTSGDVSVRLTELNGQTASGIVSLWNDDDDHLGEVEITDDGWHNLNVGSESVDIDAVRLRATDTLLTDITIEVSDDADGGGDTTGTGDVNVSRGDYASFTFSPEWEMDQDYIDFYTRHYDHFDVGSPGNQMVARIYALDPGETVQPPADATTAVADPIGSSGSYSGWNFEPSIWDGVSADWPQRGENNIVVIEVWDDADAGVAFGDNSGLVLDVGLVQDNRPDYTFPDEVDSNDLLAGPETHPESLTVGFGDTRSAFGILEATLGVEMETDNQQAIALSNDGGSTFDEVTNADEHTVDYSDDPSTQIRPRVTISRTVTDTTSSPAQGDSSQTLDSLTIDGDLETTPLVIDETFDDEVETVLNQLAGEQFVWSYRLEDGEPTIAWLFLGGRVGDRTPTFSDIEVSKALESWDSLTIKGSNQAVSEERLIADDDAAVDLNRADILPGSDVVYDETGTNFVRGDDYEIAYQDGSLELVDGSDLVDGEEYFVDYRYQISGTHDIVDDPENELVRTVPGVVSDRQAEQIAFAIGEVEPDLSKPRYEATATVPTFDVSLDPLEAIPLDDVGDIPEAATPMAIREPPELTDRGVRLQLGASPPLEASLRAISESVRSVSRRV